MLAKVSASGLPLRNTGKNAIQVDPFALQCFERNANVCFQGISGSESAEYCAPVWCHSAHTRLIDPAINDALRIVIGCLRPTPAENLPILAGIQPTELRRNGAALSLAPRSMEPGHLLQSALTRPSSADARSIKLRHPFVHAAQHLISSSDNNSIRAAHWADHQWNADWADNPTRLRIFIANTRPSGRSLGPAQPPPHRYRAACANGVWPPRAGTNGVWPPLVSVEQKNRRTNRRPCCPLMSNPSTSPWTAWPDGPGR